MTSIKILPYYVITTTFLAMAAGVMGLWFLQLVFAYLGELEDISDAYTLSQGLWYVLYRSPEYLVELMPTGVLLGAVVGLGLLSANSEIVIMRAAGVSLYRIIGWVVLPALVFVLSSVAINQWVVPVATSHSKAIKDPQSPQIVRLDGYWAMIPSDDGTRQIVHIGQADSTGNLKDVKRFTAQGGQLQSALTAQSGIAQSNNSYQWRLHDVREIWLGDQVQTRRESQELLDLPINQASIHLLTKEAEDLSISELYAHKKLMEHQQSRSKSHELIFWQKLLSGLSVLSLLLIACSFVFGSLRSQSLGFRVVIALLTGLLFRYMQDLSGFVALATDLPVLPMVLLPMVLGAMVGVYLLAKKG